VHCHIEEPKKFPSTKWFSHKFHGPGLTYQIVLSLHEDKVLSVVGPFPAGMPDISVFREAGGIFHLIPPDKRLIGDNGYNGEPTKIVTPNDHDSLIASKYKGRARARQETFNARLKEFNILAQTFRHANKRDNVENLDDHQRVFESVCALIQYDLQYVPLFEM
jgi:DDE superfamily endonuclease